MTRTALRTSYPFHSTRGNDAAHAYYAHARRVLRTLHTPTLARMRALRAS